MKFILTLTIIIASGVQVFGQQFTKDSGNRDLLFDSVDIQILKRADSILSSESIWSKLDDRKCQDDIYSNKYSFFCALYKASLDVVGEYDHRKPGLQQVRLLIQDQFKERLSGHRLMDFNNHENTNFYEIKFLLAESIKIIEKKIAEEPTSTTSYEFVENWLQLPQGFVLGRPLGLGLDTDGNLYVLHTGTRVWSNPFPETTISEKTIIKINTNNGELLENWGDHLFIMPHGLHIDHENNVWVTDIALQQIFKFNQNGDLLMTLGEAKVSGDDKNHFNRPTDVVVANDGSVYISDGYKNKRVIKFSSTGKYLLEWGSEGNEPGQFKVPHGIDLDNEGNVYIADRNNNRIQKFDSEGTFVDLWQNTLAKELYSIAIDKKRGYLFGIDYLRENDSIMGSDIIQFDLEMNLQKRIGRSGYYDGPITRYHDIEVGSDGSIYVGDILENRIQKFKLISK